MTVKSATSLLEDHIPDFQGRVLFVYLSGNATEQGKYIASPHLQMLGGRLFLVGTTPSSSKIPGSPLCVAWDRIDAYIALDSVEDFLPLTFSSDD